LIRRTKELEQLEAEFTRERIGPMTYAEALALFTSLWMEARALNPDFPGDWRSDIEPDLTLARALNGLPPRP
jgi:hypothetical protein